MQITNNLPFDLVDLRLFSLIAKSGSLTKGSDLASLSLAAASLRIKSLEEGLGAQLLYRNKRGMSLTSAGETFLEQTLLILDQAQCLRTKMQPFSKGILGHVRLFANPTAIGEFLPSVLGRFFRLHPAITVNLKECPSIEVVRAVSQGVADIGVVSGNVVADGLEALQYKVDRLVLATPVDHPLAEITSIHLADTLNHEFISLDMHSTSHSYLQKEIAQFGSGMQKRIEVSSYDAMCRMVEAGIGVGVLPEVVARRHRQSMQFRTINLLDDWAVRKHYICARKISELPVFTRELIDFILQSDSQ